MSSVVIFLRDEEGNATIPVEVRAGMVTTVEQLKANAMTRFNRAPFQKMTRDQLKTLFNSLGLRLTNFAKAHKEEVIDKIEENWGMLTRRASSKAMPKPSASSSSTVPVSSSEESDTEPATWVTVFGGDDRIVTDIFELPIEGNETILNLKEKIAVTKGFDIAKLHLWQFSTYAVGDTVPEDIGEELPDNNLACETNIHEGLQIHLMIDEGKPEDDIRDFCELDENGDYLFSADFLKKWDDDEADPVIMLNVKVTTMKGNSPITLAVPDYTTVRSFKDLVSDKINVKAGKFVLNSELFYLTCGGQSMETINATLKDYIDDDSHDLEVVLVLRLKGGGKRRKNEDESVQSAETDPDEVKLLLQTFAQKWGRADFEQMCLSPLVTLETLDEMVKASKGGNTLDFRAGKILACVPQVKAIQDWVTIDVRDRLTKVLRFAQSHFGEGYADCFDDARAFERFITEMKGHRTTTRILVLYDTTADTVTDFYDYQCLG
ncbi:unnamed protein product [Symbiodinium natans]|uniref:Ubiquitin-like domain-containing protein n=2 Tax=Symbiodinium natans TaxID=878477 RepID=A0A812GJG8_9DINO|nr:unnamed protein product [Symbiodinium natans]